MYKFARPLPVSGLVFSKPAYMHPRAGFFYFMLLFAVAACNEQNDKTGNNDKGLHDIPAKPRTGLDVEPQLIHADSLQILYYDDPDGDSLRYTRYFKYTALNDLAVIKSLIKNFDTAYRPSGRVQADCRSEGKIFLFHKTEPVKTIYFSTRCTLGCCYLYFIKDGYFYYFPLLEETALMLKEKRKNAMAP
jgi:hypothetical protein